MGDRLSRAERVGLYLHRSLDKRFNRLAVALYRGTRGRIAAPFGVDVLVLTTTGRRSGARRSVLLQYFPDGDDMLLVAAAGGDDHHPACYHNLRSQPRADVEIGARRFAVEARELGSAEIERSWPRILERAPDYERYLRATDRRLPLVRLARRLSRPSSE